MPWARVWALLLAAVVVAASCGSAAGSSAPGVPSAYLGRVLDRPVPARIASLPLTTDTGRTVTLADLHGHVVVLADFLTLCQETCPLTTANLLAMDRAVKAAGVAPRVRFVELTVDPARDTPARLRAYRQVAGAPANLMLLTASPSVIARVWRHFGVWYERIAEGQRPGRDWLTGRPLSYDVDHQDAVFYLDAAGTERFSISGNPNASGVAVPAALRRFLDEDGRRDLTDPNAGTWTASEGLAPLAWLTGHRLPATG